MIVALILAAGSGERLGAGRPKALVELAGPPPVPVEHRRGERTGVACGESSSRCPEGRAPRRASPPSRAARAARSRWRSRWRPPDRPTPFSSTTPPGRSSRSGCSSAPIAALAADADADAAIAAAPVKDTIKRVDEAGSVVETLDRSALWAVQTPQVFRRAALERALDVPPRELALATDDAWLIERSGGRVIVVALRGGEPQGHHARGPALRRDADRRARPEQA